MTVPATVDRVIGLTFVLSVCLGAPGWGQSLEPAMLVVEQAVAEKKIPGASVLIMRRGKILAAESFGLSDKEGAKRFAHDTICWIASLTKPVTAAAAMILVEQGKLRLNDPVETYLPEFKNLRTEGGQPATITVRQLMSHTSGIAASVPTRPRFFFEQEWYDQSLAEVVSAIAERPLIFAPGEKVAYSNAAPYVLGRIIELQSGKPYGEFVQDQILEKLKMKDTGFSVPPEKVDRVAIVYRRQQEESVVYCRYNPEWEVTMCMPDGGLFSTPADIARFANAFLMDGEELLLASSVQTMLSKQSEGYGLGWILDRENQFSHWGSSGTLVWADQRTGIVGVLVAQMQDLRTLAEIRGQFRDAVTEAFR